MSMTSSSSSTSITQQNNEAADLIERGSYKAALSLLSEALTRVQERLNEAGADDEDHQRLQQQESVGSAETYIINPLAAQDEQQRTALDKKLEPDEDFIYRHPVKTSQIPKNEEAYVMSVILVFNMALAHHLIGISSSSSTSDDKKEGDEESSNNNNNAERLRGALKLYELVFCMQMKSDVYMSTTCTLALVNNSAQIYRSINRERKAQKYFKHLLSSLMIMIEKGEAETLDELDGFLWNASRLILTEQAAPAA